MTISIKSRLAFTHKGSVGVRAGSIHVTRVISFTFVNIWETIYIIYMHFIMFVTLKWADSQSCNLFGYYIWENKFISLFLFHELDIWNVYFTRNISIYQADGSGKPAFPVAPTKRYHPRGVSRHKTLDQIHAVYRNYSFYWHHPGFNNYNMGRLLNLMDITKRL